MRRLIPCCSRTLGPALQARVQSAGSGERSAAKPAGFPGGRRRRSIAVSLLLVTSPLACADEPNLLAEARTALEEQIPEVATHKLQAFLATKDLPDFLRDAATLLLGRALFAADLGEDALKVLQPVVETGEPASIFLQANILAASGRWQDALPLYKDVARGPDVSAKVGEAECLRALERTAEAANLLEPLVRAGAGGVAARLRLASFEVDLHQLDQARTLVSGARPDTPEEAKWKSYVEARILLAQDQPAPALILFEEILTAPEHVSESLYFAATYGAAEAHAALYGYGEAHQVLENFIWRRPKSAYLEIAFQRLDEMYAEEEKASESELRQWAQKPEPRRAALAAFYAAKMQVRRRAWSRAAVSLDVFSHRYPAHPLLARAYLMLAKVVAEMNRLPEAIRSLDAALRLAHDPELRAEIELQEALVHYRQGEQVLAAQLFESAAKRFPRLRQVATFDAALAWVNQLKFDRFQEEFRAFAAGETGDLPRSDLVLEQGLVEARNHDPRAKDTLKRFLLEFPGNSRLAEAQLALAELTFLSGEKSSATGDEITPPDALGNGSLRGSAQSAFREASVYLQAAIASPQSPEIEEHSEYLAIFLADAQHPRDEEKIISLSRDFLRDHPDSALRPEIRMKLGQIHYRRGDFANAETQFAELAKEQSDGSYVETALFLAGKSAAQLINPGAVDRALAFFSEVVERGGPIKLYARQEQAVLQHNLGRDIQAVELYDVILSAEPPPDPQLRQSSLCAKGDSFRALGTTDPSSLEKAAAVFDQLAVLPDAFPEWRNQALYKKAKTLEQLGRDDEALDAYYEVLERSAARGDHEYFWYYKAGFDAAHVFEQKEKWKPAIGIYEKMAKLGGPRTPEIQARVRKLRLEHFIWE